MDKTPQVQANSSGPRLPPPHAESIEVPQHLFFLAPKGLDHPRKHHLAREGGRDDCDYRAQRLRQNNAAQPVAPFFRPRSRHDLHRWRRHLQSPSAQIFASLEIGIVTQEAVIFEDTIWNNIAYGNPGASPQQIEQAAMRAFAHEFIVTFSERQYDTLIGEGPDVNFRAAKNNGSPWPVPFCAIPAFSSSTSSRARSIRSPSSSSIRR